MVPIRIHRVVVLAETLAAGIVVMSFVVPVPARMAFDPKVVVGLARERPLPKTAFQQALRQGNAGEKVRMYSSGLSTGKYTNLPGSSGSGYVSERVVDVCAVSAFEALAARFLPPQPASNSPAIQLHTRIFLIDGAKVSSFSSIAGSSP